MAWLGQLPSALTPYAAAMPMVMSPPLPPCAAPSPPLCSTPAMHPGAEGTPCGAASCQGFASRDSSGKHLHWCWCWLASICAHHPQLCPAESLSEAYGQGLHAEIQLAVHDEMRLLTMTRLHCWIAGCGGPSPESQAPLEPLTSPTGDSEGDNGSSSKWQLAFSPFSDRSWERPVNADDQGRAWHPSPMVPHSGADASESLPSLSECRPGMNPSAGCALQAPTSAQALLA